MLTLPTISVVIPTYNRSALVHEAIRSVLAQTFGDFEIIVVDDGSCDDTRSVVATFSDARLRYIFKPNAGLAAARNTGIELARGRFVSFLDDDDLYLPTCLAAHMALVRSQPQVGWTSGGYLMVDANGATLDEHRPWMSHALNMETWLFWCPTVPSSVMVERDWLLRVNSFDVSLRLQEDWDMWLRLAFAGCPMAWAQESVCRYRIHTGNMVRNCQAMRSDAGILRVLDKFFAQPNVPFHLQQLREKAYAHALLKRAAASFRSGEIDAAIADTLKAIETNSELLAKGGVPALELLLGHAENVLVNDPFGYANAILDSLPEPPFAVREHRSKLLGKVAAAVLFTSSRRNDIVTARRAVAGLIRHDRSWFMNRGVRSLVFRAFAGPRISDGVTRIIHGFGVL